MTPKTKSNPRILLVCWNSEDAENRADLLRQAGYAVDVHWDKSESAKLVRFRKTPPDVLIVDQSRIPNHGRAVAGVFRTWKETRSVPLIFVDGTAKQSASAKSLLRDAIFTTQGRIKSAVKTALTRPPEGSSDAAGYSGTPLPKKLGVHPGITVLLLGAPENFEENMEPFGDGVILARRIRKDAGLILLFVKSRADMARRFEPAAKAMGIGGGLWICWPKKASGVKTDLGETFIREAGLAAGLVDYKTCALDETWSGLKFARKRITRLGAPALPRRA